MKIFRVILMLIPWILLLLALLFWSLGYSIPGTKSRGKSEIIHRTMILERVEQLGKLELVRYNFKEVYDYQVLSKGKALGVAALKSYDYTPDLKALLITSGEAVGCIDLTKLNDEDIMLNRDTLFVRLPSPELCYHKLDLENTRIFDLERKGWWSRLFIDDNEIKSVIENAYKEAEDQIRLSALEMGILDKTILNGELILKPIFQEISGKTVIFTYRPDESEKWSNQ